MGSSSSTTRIWTGPAMSATLVLLMGGWWRVWRLLEVVEVKSRSNLHHPPPSSTTFTNLLRS